MGESYSVCSWGIFSRITKKCITPPWSRVLRRGMSAPICKPLFLPKLCCEPRTVYRHETRMWSFCWEFIGRMLITGIGGIEAIQRLHHCDCGWCSIEWVSGYEYFLCFPDHVCSGYDVSIGNMMCNIFLIRVEVHRSVNPQYFRYSRWLAWFVRHVVSIPGKCAQYAQNRTLIPEDTLTS